MQITLTGQSALLVLGRLGDDRRLARALAAQLIQDNEPLTIARLLLTREVAELLLARRLRERPRRTLGELRELATSSPAAPRADRAARPRRRHRLSAIEVEALKQRVVSFLVAHPWSNRRQISGATAIPTQAIYNRIMGELRRARAVLARGEKSKAVYAARGAARKSTAARRAGRKRRSRRGG